MLLDDKIEEYVTYFNCELDKVLSNLNENTPIVIRSAIKYAVGSKGKRVRPLLAFLSGDMLGVPKEDIIRFALSIEFIHSYSLVHDDLPAMDNDDFRRGELSTHKKFGEAFGILCGDALLNLAFEMLLSGQLTEKELKVAKIIAEYSGYQGMIAGQVLDILNEKTACKNEKAEDVLFDIYINKTAKLLTAPLLVSSSLAGGTYFEELKNYGYNLGILFQITDDILDVESDLKSIGKTPHKDENSNKLTSVKVYGLSGAKEKAKYHFDKCLDILSTIEDSEYLAKFTEKIFARKK